MKNFQFAFALILAFFAVSLANTNAAISQTEPPVAQVDYFLKLKGIDGEATDARHKGWIVIRSVDFDNESRTVILKHKTSASLNLACVSGQHFAQVVLHQRSANGTYYTITLEDVLVSGYQSGGSEGSVEIEQLSLTYSKMSRD